MERAEEAVRVEDEVGAQAPGAQRTGSTLTRRRQTRRSPPRKGNVRSLTNVIITRQIVDEMPAAARCEGRSSCYQFRAPRQAQRAFASADIVDATRANPHPPDRPLFAGVAFPDIFGLEHVGGQSATAGMMPSSDSDSDEGAPAPKPKADVPPPAAPAAQVHRKSLS